MIRSFRDADTEKIFRDRYSKQFHAISKVAQRKLAMLDAAQTLRDLTVFPGNRLEALKGDREGQHSIRVNDQYRVCFVWTEPDATDVEIVDYH
jgi:toxin HigB-1